MSKEQKPLTDVEAIAKIAKVLDKLTPEQRAKVLKFFTE